MHELFSFRAASLAVLILIIISLPPSAQTISPEILQMHQEEIDRESAQLAQDELNLIAERRHPVPQRHVEPLDVAVRKCSRLLALGILVEAGRHFGANPSQAALLIQQDPSAARHQLANAVNKSTTLLESMLKSLVVADQNQEEQVLSLCSQ